MNFERFQRYDEAVFFAGTLTGVVVFSLGLAFLILGLSVGVREGEYLTETQDLALGVAGLALIGIGLALRIWRDRLADRFEWFARYGGMLLFLLGSMAALFAVSAETTVSAPYLAQPGDKAVLFTIAFVFIVFGLMMIRGSGKVVGW